VLVGEVRLTNTMALQDTLVLTNGEAGFARGGTNTLERIPRLELDLRVRGLVQTFLYSPGLLHLDDLGVSLAVEPVLAESVKAYAEGNIRLALALYPTNRLVASRAERFYLAALVLSVGDFQQAQSLVATNLATLGADAAQHQRLGRAIQQVIAAAEGLNGGVPKCRTHRPNGSPSPTTSNPGLASETSQRHGRYEPIAALELRWSGR